MIALWYFFGSCSVAGSEEVISMSCMACVKGYKEARVNEGAANSQGYTNNNKRYIHFILKITIYGNNS